MRAIERFESRIDRSGPCHEWTGITRKGYGTMHWNKRRVNVHRLAWELAHGAIPDGAMVLHRCNNRRCVNVAHLYIGNNSDNQRDAVAAGTHYSYYRGRTHCINGHEYKPGSWNWDKSLRTLEAAILRALREATGIKKLRQKDIMEWRTSPIEPQEGETVIHLPDPGVYVAYKKP